MRWRNNLWNLFRRKYSSSTVTFYFRAITVNYPYISSLHIICLNRSYRWRHHYICFKENSTIQQASLKHKMYTGYRIPSRNQPSSKICSTLGYSQSWPWNLSTEFAIETTVWIFQSYFPFPLQHFLNFLPFPHGQSSFTPIFRCVRTMDIGLISGGRRYSNKLFSWSPHTTDLLFVYSSQRRKRQIGSFQS